MATQTEQQVAAPVPESPASCYKKKPQAPTFFENVVDRIDEFVHAPLDQHKACFKNTIHKVSEMPKAIKARICESNEAAAGSSVVSSNKDKDDVTSLL